MKVIHLIKTGVGASWALRQIQVLLSFDVEVIVVLDQDGPMREKYIAAGAKVYIFKIDIAAIPISDLYNSIRIFRNFIIKESPDLIHSHFVGTTLFMRLALRSVTYIPRVFQVPGPLHLERFFPRILELWSSMSNDYWIATCKKTKFLYTNFGVDPTKVFLSYYGTNTDSFVRLKSDNLLRSELGISNDTKIIGMVAFMYPPRRWLGQKTGLKGHEDLIDAIQILCERGRNVVGVFVGGAWGDSEWYEDRVRNYGRERLGSRAIFLGNRSDVINIYSIFDVAVHPSHSENVGGAVESLLLRVPTVATNVGGFPDLILDAETGFLSEPHNPQSLALSIERALDNFDKSSSMIEAGYILSARLFDVNRTGKEIFDIYKCVIGGFNSKFDR